MVSVLVLGFFLYPVTRYPYTDRSLIAHIVYTIALLMLMLLLMFTLNLIAIASWDLGFGIWDWNGVMHQVLSLSLTHKELRLLLHARCYFSNGRAMKG